MRLHQRGNQRNSHSCQKIGQQRIGRQAGCASTQFTGNDSRSGCSGTNEADHCTFKHFPVDLLHRATHQQYRNNQARNRLEQQ